MFSVSLNLHRRGFFNSEIFGNFGDLGNPKLLG